MSAHNKKAALQEKPPRVKVDTRQRIIDRTIALFNRYGIQNVAIDYICADLKISPGNLTYHFKRKDDLIQATLDVLREQLRVALQRPVAVASAKDGAEYLIRVFRTLWDFRFFFNSLAYLLTDSPKRRKEYARLHDWVLDMMESDLGYMVESGLFHAPVAPNNFRLLSENIWGHFLNWLRLQQIQSPAAATPSNKAIYEAALHLWSLCHLWLKPQFANDLLKVFQELLVPDELQSKKKTR